MLLSFLLVALGGALGSVCRYAISLWLAQPTGSSPSWISTMVVNLCGALLIGVLMAILQRSPNGAVSLFFITGLCGGFTTFSALSADFFRLMQAQQIVMAIGYVGATLCSGLLLTWIGYTITHRLLFRF